METKSGPSKLELNREKLQAVKGEYHRLCYEMRKKELMRNSTQAKMQQQIRKQWAKISDLENKKSELISQLRMQESSSFANKGNKFMENFMKSLDEIIKLEEQVKKQTEQIEWYKQETTELDKKIRQKQKEVVKAHQSKDRIYRHQKNISFLENRLNNSLNKYSQLLVTNSALREEINSVLLTQIQFRRKYRSIKQLLSLGKKTLSEVIHSATVSYQTGESIKYKLNLIKERTQVDQKKLGEKIKELQLLIEQDKQLKEFLDFKAKERAGSRESDELDSKNEQILEQKLQQCHGIMARIQLASGCKDVNRTCKTYIQQEETNLALFEKMNEMNLEIEQLHEEVRSKREELEIVTRQYKEQKRKDLAIKLDIEHATDKLRKEALELEDATDAVSDDLEYVKKVLQRIYVLLDGVSSQNVTLTVDDAITDDNMLLYLEALERRIIDLVRCHKFFQHKTAKQNVMHLKEKKYKYKTARSETSRSSACSPVHHKSKSISYATTTSDAAGKSEDILYSKEGLETFTKHWELKMKHHT